jgi:hypothetical protein
VERGIQTLTRTFSWSATYYIMTSCSTASNTGGFVGSRESGSFRHDRVRSRRSEVRKMDWRVPSSFTLPSSSHPTDQKQRHHINESSRHPNFPLYRPLRQFLSTQRPPSLSSCRIRCCTQVEHPCRMRFTVSSSLVFLVQPVLIDPRFQSLLS